MKKLSKLYVSLLCTLVLVGSCDLNLDKVLEKNGNKPSQTSLNKSLLIASKNGNLQQVQALLQAGADVNAQDLQGYTALMYAAQGGHDTVLATLLKNKANPTIQDKRGNDVLAFLSAQPSASTMQLLKSALTQHKASPATMTAFSSALAKQGTKSQTELNNELFLWAERGLTSRVRAVLAQGAEINSAYTTHSNYTPLAAAINGYHEETVMALLSYKNIDVNKAYGNYDLSSFPLREAAISGQASIFYALLKHPNIDVNQQDHEGRTTLSGLEKELTPLSVYKDNIRLSDKQKQEIQQQITLLKQKGAESVSKVVIDGMSTRTKALEIKAGTTHQFTATITQSPNKVALKPHWKICWSAGNGRGYIDQTGLYTAPKTLTTSSKQPPSSTKPSKNPTPPSSPKTRIQICVHAGGKKDETGSYHQDVKTVFIVSN